MDSSIEIYKQLIIDDNNLPENIREIKSIIEALLFTAGEPLDINDISNILQISKKPLRTVLSEMVDEFKNEKRGIQIITFNGKYQLCTKPEHMVYIRRMLKPQNKQSLSRAAIETVAIIAYKQPITRQAIDAVRGVKCDRIINNLIEKKLIKEVGRLDTPGRPILYGTTDDFLKYFGLKDINELPKLEELAINA